MSLLKVIGRKVLSAVTGDSCCPSEGEIRYNEYNDAVDTIFKVFSLIDTSMEWGRVLHALKEAAAGTLHVEAVRKSLEEPVCKVEYARVYMIVILKCANVEAMKNLAVELNQESHYDTLLAMVNLTLSINQLLDYKIGQLDLSSDEKWAFRKFFDVACTRLPHVSLVRCRQSNNDIAKTLDAHIDAIFRDQSLVSLFKHECDRMRVSFDVIKQKFGR